MTDNKSRVFRFADVEVIEREFLLVKAGKTASVEPKAFRVFLFLLGNPGRLVTKDEIIDAVWNDCSVSDNSLTKSIATLRRLLGDDPREPQYIATVQTVGYRFLCDVTVTEPDPGPSLPSNSSVDIAIRPEWRPVLSDPAILPDYTVAILPRPPTAARRKMMVIGASAAIVVLVAAIGFIQIRKPRRANVVESRITANPQDRPVLSSAISPDGKYLAFTDKTGMYLRQVEGGETHKLSFPEDFPRADIEGWFPDSVHLVVSSWTEGTRNTRSLWRVSTMGGTPIRLNGAGSFARVSPDGSQIAFLQAGLGRSELWLMSSDGEAPHKIVGADESDEQYLSPVAWSPDSRRVAYVRRTIHLWDRDTATIEIFDLASGRTDRLISNPALGQLLAWPQENSLIYTRSEDAPNEKDSNLWRTQPDSRDSGVRISNGRGFIGQISATKDGKILALKRVEYQADIYIAELGEGGKKLLSPNRLTNEKWDDEVHSWTPDSKAILLVSDRDGRQHIFRQGIDQAQPELLIGGDHDYSLPRLNPDGGEILYLQMPGRDEASHDIRVMRTPLEGGGPQQLLRGPAIWNLQCARIPSTLCIYSSGPPYQVKFFSFKAKSGESERFLASKLADVDWPSWSLSADGKYLAVSVTKLGNDTAIRILSTSGDFEKIIPLPGWREVSGVDWAVDSKSLWVSACTHLSSWGAYSPCTLLKVDLDGRFTVVHEDGGEHYVAALPSPDGKRLALPGSSADDSNIWLARSIP
jgi:DNA-binding winged helix-turn-helix (wHTH) protein/Tol biopolymer transport system component